VKGIRPEDIPVSQSMSDRIFQSWADELFSSDSGDVEIRGELMSGGKGSLFSHLTILCMQSNYFKTSIHRDGGLISQCFNPVSRKVGLGSLTGMVSVPAD
jgi:hypothetical protein